MVPVGKEGGGISLVIAEGETEVEKGWAIMARLLNAATIRQEDGDKAIEAREKSTKASASGGGRGGEIRNNKKKETVKSVKKLPYRHRSRDVDSREGIVDSQRKNTPL